MSLGRSCRQAVTHRKMIVLFCCLVLFIVLRHGCDLKLSKFCGRQCWNTRALVVLATNQHVTTGVELPLLFFLFKEAYFPQKLGRNKQNAHVHWPWGCLAATRTWARARTRPKSKPGARSRKWTWTWTTRTRTGTRKPKRRIATHPAVARAWWRDGEPPTNCDDGDDHDDHTAGDYARTSATIAAIARRCKWTRTRTHAHRPALKKVSEKTDAPQKSWCRRCQWQAEGSPGVFRCQGWGWW